MDIVDTGTSKGGGWYWGVFTHSNLFSGKDKSTFRMLLLLQSVSSSSSPFFVQVGIRCKGLELYEGG